MRTPKPIKLGQNPIKTPGWDFLNVFFSTLEARAASKMVQDGKASKPNMTQYNTML